jgi:hypothetical protein
MVTHTVRRGDTLGSLARRYYGRASRFPLIVAANDIEDPDKLSVGAALVIPNMDVASRAPLSPRTPLRRGSARASRGPGAAAPADTPPGPLSISEQRLERVHPALASRVRALLEQCAIEGLSLLVTQGLRTANEQDALYAKGRTAPPIGSKFIVTKAKGGQSYHNFGLAIDIVVLDALGKADWNVAHPGWARAAAIGKSLGLEWGGDWKGFKDIPHFQYTGGVSLGQCRSLCSDGFEPLWEQIR